MKPHIPGVFGDSTQYFHVPSSKAPELFFYPLCTGHFYCDPQYDLNRINFNSYLFLFILEGSGYVEIDNTTYPVSKGSLAYIDCYKPHRYYTLEGFETLWVHFDGPLARAYFREISSNPASIFRPNDTYEIKKNLDNIYTFFHNSKAQLNEALISNMINNLLTCLLMEKAHLLEGANKANPLKDTLVYIVQHFDEALTVEDLARRIHFSKYYFIRIFKQEVGYTPYEYILMTRVNAATLELKSTDNAIKNVAIHNGFSNESSFCKTFKKLTGMTPMEYRNTNGH